MVLAEPTGRLVSLAQGLPRHSGLCCALWVFAELLLSYYVCWALWHGHAEVELLAFMGPAALGREPIFIYHFLPWVL